MFNYETSDFGEQTWHLVSFYPGLCIITSYHINMDEGEAFRLNQGI